MIIDSEFIRKGPWKSNIFEGKVVFITGGAGTICRGQAEAMVLLGANVAIIGRNPQKTENAAREIQQLRVGSKVIACSNTDVREVQSLVKAVNKTVQELGRIDYVIAGAAGNFLSDFNHLSSNAFKSVVSIDLLGSFNTAKACFEQLRKNKGSILFVSATLHYYGIPFQIHVGAAKAGVDALSNALAVELGPLGIRSNCIAPGLIKGTEGFERLLTGLDIESKIPLQRYGTVEDIAQATIFLFSLAGDYVNGSVQIVDGGAWHRGVFSTRYEYPVNIIGLNSSSSGKL